MELRTGIKNVIKSLIASGGTYECSATHRNERLGDVFVVIRSGKQYIVPNVRDTFGCVRPIRLRDDKPVVDTNTVFLLDDPSVIRLHAVCGVEGLDALVR